MGPTEWGGPPAVQPWSFFIVCPLLLPQEHMYRAAEEIEIRTELVLKESSVRLAYVLRKIAEERK